KADDPLVQRGVGLMRTRLRVAGWALDGALAATGDDPGPSMEKVAAVMAAKREIALAGIEVTDLAMELAGGASYRRGSRIQRAGPVPAGARARGGRPRPPAPPSSPRPRPSRRCPTPVASPSACPPTSCEKSRGELGGEAGSLAARLARAST